MHGLFSMMIKFYIGGSMALPALFSVLLFAPGFQAQEDLWDSAYKLETGNQYATYRSTCPQNVRGCKSENVCGSCHPSCLYCQRISHSSTDPVECGFEDCMQCLPGLVHVIEFTDGTGKCVPDDKLYRDTCPRGVGKCHPGNKCTKCHDTCEYCQGETDQCTYKDCISCARGYSLGAIFTDESGECLPPGVQLEKHEDTCPPHHPGCHEDNRCHTCPEGCQYCQDLNSLDGFCKHTRCLKCANGYEFVRHKEGGQCRRPNEDKHKKESPKEPEFSREKIQIQAKSGDVISRQKRQEVQASIDTDVKVQAEPSAPSSILLNISMAIFVLSSVGIVVLKTRRYFCTRVAETYSKTN